MKRPGFFPLVLTEDLKNALALFRFRQNGLHPARLALCEDKRLANEKLLHGRPMPRGTSPRSQGEFEVARRREHHFPEDTVVTKPGWRGSGQLSFETALCRARRANACTEEWMNPLA